MDNYNATTHGDKLPQHLLEAFQKLAHAGASDETISSFLGLKLEVVRQVLASDPLQVAKLTESITEESKKYRCVMSNRLMTSPVMAPDGNYYEQSCIEAHPSISSERALLNPKKKAKILEFCRESLNGLAVHLRRKEPPEEILELSAECLSVLSIETEMQTFLKVLGAVGEETLAKLSDKLRHLVGEEYLITLMHRSTEELPSLALCLAKLFMLELLSERAFEEAFRCFTELLSQATLSAGAIDLAEQVSERLNSTQLSQMNQALKTQPREEEVELRLERLRLREAYLRLREGDTETAVGLVNTLQNTLHLEREVLEFYQEAGMNCGKVSVLKLTLSTALELVGRESPSLAAALDTFQQLFYAELQALSSEAASKQALDSLRGEIRTLQENHVQVANQCKRAQSGQEAMLQELQEESQRSEAATQECLISLRAELRALNEQAVKSEEEAKRVQSFIEQSQQAESAAQGVVGCLRGEVTVLSKDLAQVEHLFKRAQSALDATLQGLQEQFQEAEAASQKALNSLSDKVEALTGEHLKDWEEILQVKRAQDAWIQRSEAASEESLISLWAELRALNEQAAKSEAEAKRVQSYIEQSQKTKAATQGVLSRLRGEVTVLSKDLAQVANLCQSANEETLRSIERKSLKSEAAAQKALYSLSDKVEALTGKHFKAGEEISQIKRAQYTQYHRLDEKLNEAEAATQQKLNILRGDVWALRTDLGQALSQCKQVQLAQEAMLQRLNRAETSLQDTRETLYGATLP
jgi:hypothetical protein